jgi:hypothetical protein
VERVGILLDRCEVVGDLERLFQFAKATARRSFCRPSNW